MQLTLSGKKYQLKDSIIQESRVISTEIQDYLNNNYAQINPLEYEINGSFSATAFSEVLDEDLPKSKNQIGRELFIIDVIRLAEKFFRSTKSKNIGVKIEVIHTNMCRLFHADNVCQRLLCTYVGPGTEWLDHDNVKREGIGKGKNENIVKDFSRVNHAKPFETILLKGLKYGRGHLPVVHRSPEVEKDGLMRVLLKIDECDAV